MYLSHFGLNEVPFSITPNPAFFYEGGKRGPILEALAYAVTHGEGIVKVTGEVGSGKTMLCRMLASMLPENTEVIYLVNPTLNRDEVLYAIAGELGLATGGKRADEVVRLMQHDLIQKHVNGKRVVLLIEEAQAMPLDTLEEIRLFSNLETAHNKLLQIVLFGQPELDESLALPRMRQLKERITHSFKVPPLDPAVIPEYLMFRMRAAGYRGPDVFSKEAVAMIARVSQGVVRRISILADKSLLAAFAANTHAIGVAQVKAAINDSEFSAQTTSRMRRVTQLAIVSVALVALITAAWTIYQKRRTDSARAAMPTTALGSAGKIVAAQPAPVSPAALADKSPTSTSAPTASVTSVEKTISTARSETAAVDLLQQRLDRSYDWLNREVLSNYSVQLSRMSTANRQHVERFLQTADQNLGRDKVMVFPTRAGKLPYIAIIYGSFATHAEAVAAINLLTDEWGYRPQLRTVAGIRREIARVQASDLWKQ